MIEIVQNLPENISLCPDLKNRARFFFIVQYLGCECSPTIKVGASMNLYYAIAKARA
jgi:hypothetical protein